jgi:hypothetical protein
MVVLVERGDRPRLRVTVEFAEKKRARKGKRKRRKAA